jgi:hypothetical protein
MTTILHRSSNRLPTLAMLGILTASMTLAAPQQAEADHPVAVAAIGAGAAVAVAIIGAAGVIGAALIGGAADVGVAAIDASSNGGEGGEVSGDGDGGGEDGGDSGGGSGGEGQHGDSKSGDRFAAANAMQQQGCYAVMPGGNVAGSGPNTSKVRNISGVPLNMQGFMSRNIDLKLTWDQPNQSLGALVDYHVDGDVMQSPAQCDYIYNSDTITWNLGLIENPNAANDYFLFFFEELVLTTTNVPDTFGRSSVVFKAFQGQTQIWSWSASARQGFASTHGPVPPFSTVTSSTGELMIENFLVPIPVTFPPGSNTTNVRIEMTYAGRGERW